jgi:hypothetical protein
VSGIAGVETLSYGLKITEVDTRLHGNDPSSLTLRRAGKVRQNNRLHILTAYGINKKIKNMETAELKSTISELLARVGRIRDWL